MCACVCVCVRERDCVLYVCVCVCVCVCVSEWCLFECRRLCSCMCIRIYVIAFMFGVTGKKTLAPTIVLVTKHARIFLTRFNKNATQGAPQMAVDKEANSLSRVYSYYSKFNLRLFYV